VRRAAGGVVRARRSREGCRRPGAPVRSRARRPDRFGVDRPRRIDMCAVSTPPRRPGAEARALSSSGRPSSSRAKQRFVDEQAHALRLAADPAHRRAGRQAGPRRRAEQLGVRPHRRERRPQLMRLVGDEAAQLPLRGLERPQRRLARGPAASSARACRSAPARACRLVRCRSPARHGGQISAAISEAVDAIASAAAALDGHHSPSSPMPASTSASRAAQSSGAVQLLSTSHSGIARR